MAPPRDPEENTKQMVPATVIAGTLRILGFTGNDVVVGTAICLAESGGDRTAVGRAVPERPDYGLAQINFIHAKTLGEGFFPPGVGWKQTTTNLRALRTVFREKNSWSPWVVYQTGAYRTKLAEAQKAAATPLGAAQQGEINTELGGQVVDGGIVTIPGDFGGDGMAEFDGLFDGLGPALWIGGGAVLVVLGVLMMAKNLTPMGMVANVAGSAMKGIGK